MNGLKCRTCGGDAKYIGYPKDKNGEPIKSLEWPICDTHHMIAIIAGFDPQPIIEEKTHEMYGA